MVSRFAGFLRDLALSYSMGASAGFVADAFNTAWSFPNLFRRMFAEGAFAAAFVPDYSKRLATEGKHSSSGECHSKTLHVHRSFLLNLSEGYGYL